MPLIFKVLTGLVLASLATSCWWRGKLDKDDCEDFEKNDEQCENIYHGRLQATEMTADLYKVGINSLISETTFK